MPTLTHQWILNSKPLGLPILPNKDITDNSPTQTFKLTTTFLPSPSPTQVLIKTIYLSNDPAQRGWISAAADPARLYVLPLNEGDTMGSYGIAEVISSGDVTRLTAGTLVLTKTNWTEYSIQDIDDCHTIQTVDGLSPTHFLGSFGLTGVTAYYGLVEVVKATKDDSVVISGAAGATGSMAVQIAKWILGCRRVIGIAGSEEKCRWVESIGADVCINYRKESFEDDLRRETEGFVDVFYDNIGGRILDLMLLRVKRHGRIAACGTISNYNKDADPIGLRNFYEIISNRITVHGFLILDYYHKIPETTELLVQAWKDGKIKVNDATETVVDAKFEDIPSVWMKLFEGGNTGKLITRII
ncbi:hypothetical protein EYZ11_004702 [Aspergillus tanneri]|uniref:Enoyl reductase (ER) domain-containing protein n=1 Tax=Aspergillus tanneri TaxID=1220188 RepID=A0A4S3JK77_9EURO|nr:uncharacterized protein ATNIH1004_003555 [Aspergillus tanneri]KAA8650866.1 hypothetical protein ATNIH1004_003555 [Aspergillus tanneri]THC95832.1 hypothetical protein EYZ11_004702 [Aspergillus tanneri]